MNEAQLEFLRNRGITPGSATEQEQDRQLLLVTEDGGKVFEIQGQLYFTSPGYSTSDPDKIREIIAQERKGGQTPRQMQESQMRQELIGKAPVVARVAKTAQGIPFIGEGFDEAVSALSPTAGRQVRSLQEAMQQERPVESTLLRMAGGMAGAPFEGPAAATTAGSLLRGGIVGAGEGAASSILSGPEGDRAQNLMSDIALGGAVGGVAKAGGDALQVGIENAMDKGARAIADEFGVSIEAAKIIKATFERGGDPQEALNNIRRAGQAGMLADAGMDVQVFLDAMMRLSPSAARESSQSIGERLAGSGQRLGRQLDESLGAVPQGSDSALRELQLRSAPARGRLYDVAYGKTIDYDSPEGQQILSVMERIPEQYRKRAVERANEALLMDKNTPDVAQISVNFDADGKMVFTEQPTVRQLDELKKALQEEGMAIQGQSPTDYRAQRYMAAGRELRDATTGAVPIYGRAVEAGGDNIRETEIFEVAGKLLDPKLTREQFGRLMQGTTQFERNAAKIGARNAIDDILSNARRALNSDDPQIVSEARKLLMMASSRNSQDKLKILLGYDEATKLLRSMDEMRASFNLRAATSQGSQTAARMETGSLLQDVLAPGAFVRAQRGEPMLAAKDVLQALTGTSDARLALNNQEVLRQAANVLTGKTGNRTAEEAYKIIVNALDGKKITPAQRKIVETALNLVVPATREGAQSYKENQ